MSRTVIKAARRAARIVDGRFLPPTVLSRQSAEPDLLVKKVGQLGNFDYI